MNEKTLNECSREELLEIIKSLKKQKKFGLVWEDKPEKVATECKQKLPVIKEETDKAISDAGIAEPTNLIIEGDNYHALSVLNYTHAGKIDVIYIDPPYNTGNKDFTYNDRYVDGEDAFRHSKWLSFMEKRLRLAHSLLTDDGIIFISIDEVECSNLKLLCDEIFGHQNYISSSFVLDNLKGKTNDNLITSVGSRLYVYAKDIKRIVERGGFSSVENIFAEKIEDKYKQFDEEGPYNSITFKKTGQAKFREDRPMMYYPILVKNDTLFSITEDEYKRIYDKDSKSFNDAFLLELREKYSEYDFILPMSSSGEHLRWTSGYNTFVKKMNIDIIYDGGIKQKSRPEANEMLQIYASGTPKSLMYKPEYSMGTQDLKKILPNTTFSFPKPIRLIKDILSMTGNSNVVILDFFAGSGTTGQAVLELNKEDGGHRQFILCTNNENGIAEKVTYPRIKAVVEGYGDTEGIPANIRYFKTDFVEKDETLDRLRRRLSPACEDMIRIREGAFEKIIDDDKFKVYKNSRGLTAVVFDRFELADYIARIEELETDAPVHLYVFSYTNYDRLDELSDNLNHTYESQPIPEGVLEIYKRIFSKGGKR